ncbi:type VII secretion target [Saccharomonospora cyanea]|uniref:Excreted virulence factor EspC, type VII ESX diderm n=1 Tax=Saccharomonospora cyanea NA-134 TaxID=882082 RepID=H5XGY4_9PSEU|nr:type VII secretion target [Saccharomonospora cyanea]EHR62711.1 Protein of unknown function (DUF2580) [Saccharomonospora cyanea NA-134]
MSTGFRVESEYLTKFADHLDTLRDNIDSTAGVVGGCVGDVGIFGLVGQLFGAGASAHCDKARDQLNSYSEDISRCAEDLRQAARAYESGDDEAELNISRYQV